MKSKLVLMGIGLAVALGGVWIARSMWLSHHGIVSLKVRNAPVAEVIRSLERQTGQKISMDRKLDGLVTLNMKNQPLAKVLDRVAEQSGASWRTVHAVYDSTPALRDLEAVLYGDKKMEESGWKAIAPEAMPLHGGFDPSQLAGMPGGGGPAKVFVRRGGPGGDGIQVTGPDGGAMPLGSSIVTADADVRISAGGDGKSIQKMREGPPAVVRVMRKKGDGNGATSEEVEIWTPEEIVLESRLSDRLSDFHAEPTLASANEAAKKVKGKVKTYYAMKKSPLGMAMEGMSLNLNRDSGRKVALKPINIGSGTNLTNVMNGAMPSTAEMEVAIRDRKANEFGRLTPEQRVQRARDRQNLSQPQP